MSAQPSHSVILIPKHLAEAIEWVLRPAKDARATKPPDVSRLTSEQMQLLPLPVAEALMDLTLATLQPATARREAPSQSSPRELWVNPRAKQRARRVRQRESSLAAARHRLYSWYIQTGSAGQRGFVKQ